MTSEKEKNYPSRTADQFVVRLPDGMRDRIAESAKANKRSMNAEIVARLQESFSPVSREGTLEDAIKIFQAEAEKMGAKFQLVFEKRDKP
jgi:hypothetical protein